MCSNNRWRAAVVVVCLYRYPYATMRLAARRRLEQRFFFWKRESVSEVFIYLPAWTNDNQLLQVNKGQSNESVRMSQVRSLELKAVIRFHFRLRVKLWPTRLRTCVRRRFFEKYGLLCLLVCSIFFFVLLALFLLLSNALAVVSLNWYSVLRYRFKQHDNLTSSL